MTIPLRSVMLEKSFLWKAYSSVFDKALTAGPSQAHDVITHPDKMIYAAEIGMVDIEAAPYRKRLRELREDVSKLSNGVNATIKLIKSILNRQFRTPEAYYSTPVQELSKRPAGFKAYYEMTDKEYAIINHIVDKYYRGYLLDRFFMSKGYSYEDYTDPRTGGLNSFAISFVQEKFPLLVKKTDSTGAVYFDKPEGGLRFPDHISGLKSEDFNVAHQRNVKLLSAAIEHYAADVNFEINHLKNVIKRVEQTVKPILNKADNARALEQCRDMFNASLSRPDYVPFPTMEELRKISAEKKITLTQAFHFYDSQNRKMNVCFAVPPLAVFQAYHRAAKDKVIFDELSESQKRGRILAAIDFVSRYYRGAEFRARSLSRIKIYEKYLTTLERIESSIAAEKAQNIYIKARRYSVSSDSTMSGLFGIDLSWPKITIPDIKLPKITLPNITLPKIDIDLPSFDSLFKSRIYIPVVSEALDFGGDLLGNVAATVGDLTEAVIKAGGDFIESSGKFIANSPQMVGDIIKTTGEIANDVLISPAEQFIDGAAYAILPDHIAQKIDEISDLPSEAATGQLTFEDIKEAATASMKLAIAPAAFMGEVTSDVLNSAIENIELVRELDELSGGMISSTSRVADAVNTEYKGEKHDPRLLIDSIKVGVLAIGGYAAVSSLSQSMAVAKVQNITGIGGSELDTLVRGYTAYTSGQGIGDILANEAQNQAYIQGSKEVARQTGIPVQILANVGQAHKNGTSMTEAFTESTTAVAKQEINEEIKRQTGLPITITDIGKAADPQERNEFYDKLKGYVADAKELEDKLIEQAKLAYEKEKKRIADQMERAKELASEIQNFDLGKELDLLGQKLDSELENIKETLREIDQDIEDFSLSEEIDKLGQKASDAWDDFNKDADEFSLADELEKKWDEFWEQDLLKKYGPDLLAYLYKKYGPRPDYDDVMTAEDRGKWDWQPSEKKPVKKGKIPTGLKVAGGILAAMTVASMSGE